MKSIITTSLLLALTVILNAQNPVLSIDDKLPSAEIEMNCATSGQTHSLSDLKKDNGLLVIFSCNTCPFVVAWEDRYPMVNEIAKDNKVGVVLLNSNYKKRDNDDSWEAMQAHAKKNDYKWPYLLDKESVVANAFGAQTTPHVFLFDKDLKLVYKGAIDDSHSDAAKVEDFYLKDALTSLGNGDAIAVSETRNLGCSIKRKTN